MHRLWSPISLALMILALPALAAQQPAPDLVPFKVSWTAQNQSIPIATEPTVVTQPGMLTGQSDVFGPFTGVSLATLHIGVDGKPLFATVVGEWTLASGDALSVEAVPVFTPQPAPGAPLFVAAFLITNGKGRFLGARGSGFVQGTMQIDPATGKGTVVLSAEGLITPPK